MSAAAAAMSPKDAALARAWAVVRQPLPGQDRQGLPARTWAAMPIRTKSVLVMLGAKTMDDPREVARRPWQSLSTEDREGIAACARELSNSLRDSSCLF
jgi:hypothetical protein